MTRKEKMRIITAAFGVPIVSSDGINIAVVCPLCRSKKHTTKKKLSIRLDDDRYHCWHCESKGRSIVTLLRRFAPALASQFSPPVRAHENFFDITPAEEHAERHADPCDLPDDFALLADRTGSAAPIFARALEYLRKRGIDDRDLWYFGFGVSDRWQFRNRVIMPSFDATGALNYYTARSIIDDGFRKYYNSPRPKSEIIFNEIKIDWSRELTIVEGPFDLTKANENAVPLLGSALGESSRLFQMIARHGTPVTLVLDGGEHKKTRTIAERFASYGIDVSVVDLGKKGIDPGGMTKEAFAEALGSRVRWNSLDRLADLL